MNLNLKAIYYCATNARTWGKGRTISEAKKNACLHSRADEKKRQFYVMAALFDDPTTEELENLFACITADQIDGSPKYYDAERTEEDTKMIKEKHIGWLTVEKNY